MSTGTLKGRGFFLFMFCSILILQGCSTINSDRKLYGGTGGYTGQFYIYRVDDAWAPNGETRASYKIGDYSDDINKQMREWVPIRKNIDISGLDGPERIVTNDDFVKITLRNVFIKYFKETGKKGEIAFILSFACGEKSKEDLLIYASKGQTLGSSLALDDITIIGPEKLPGLNLRMRIVMIEIDKIQNESMKNLIKQSVGLASAIQPQYASAVKIAGDLAQFIISSNEDDIIFDRTFEFAMAKKGMTVDSMPLLYGNYILMLQEDRLQGKDINKKASIATRPPAADEMRFNLYDNKLYQTYIYRPELLKGRENFTALDFQSVKTENKYDLGNKVVDMNQFYLYQESKDYAKNDTEHFSVLNTINSAEASEFRHKFLAFPKFDKKTKYKKVPGDKIGDYNIAGTLGETLTRIFCDSVRYSHEENECDDIPSGDKLVNPHYPVSLYPQGYTLLAQYPFHTHIVLSISRVAMSDEMPAENRLITYASWLDKAVKDTADDKAVSDTFENIKKSVVSQSLLDKVLKKASGEGDIEKKKCILAKAVVDNDKIVEKGLLLNEIYHLTGDIFTTTDEVKAKLSSCLKQ